MLSCLRLKSSSTVDDKGCSKGVLYKHAACSQMPAKCQAQSFFAILTTFVRCWRPGHLSGSHGNTTVLPYL